MDSIRSRRAKAISTRLQESQTDADKQDAVQARIEALENDGNTAEDLEAAGSDDEYQMEESDEGRQLHQRYYVESRVVRSFG